MRVDDSTGVFFNYRPDDLAFASIECTSDGYINITYRKFNTENGSTILQRRIAYEKGLEVESLAMQQFDLSTIELVVGTKRGLIIKCAVKLDTNTSDTIRPCASFMGLQDIIDEDYVCESDTEWQEIGMFDAPVNYVEVFDDSSILAADGKGKLELFIPHNPGCNSSGIHSYAKISLDHVGDMPPEALIAAIRISGAAVTAQEECEASMAVATDGPNDHFVRRYSIMAKCFGVDVAESGCDVLLLGTKSGDVFWVAIQNCDGTTASSPPNNSSFQLNKLCSFHSSIEGFELLDLHPHVSFSAAVSSSGAAAATSFSTNTASQSRKDLKSSMATHLAIAVHGGEVILLGVAPMCGVVVGDDAVWSIHSDPEARYVGYFRCGDSVAGSNDTAGAFVTLSKGLLYASRLGCNGNRQKSLDRLEGVRAVRDSSNASKLMASPSILVTDPTCPPIVSCCMSKHTAGTGAFAVRTSESATVHLITPPKDSDKKEVGGNPGSDSIAVLRKMLCPQNSKQSKDSTDSGAASDSSTIAQIKNVIEEIDSLVTGETVIQQQIQATDMEIRQLAAFLSLMDGAEEVSKRSNSSNDNRSSSSAARNQGDGVVGLWKSLLAVAVVLRSEIGIGGNGLGGGSSLFEVTIYALNRTVMTALHGRTVTVRCQNTLLYSSLHSCGHSHSCEFVFAPLRAEEVIAANKGTAGATTTGASAARQQLVEQFVCRFNVPVFIDTLAPYRVSIDVVIPHVASDFDIQQLTGGNTERKNVAMEIPPGIGMQPNEQCGTVLCIYDAEVPLVDIVRMQGTECVRANNLLKRAIKNLNESTAAMTTVGVKSVGDSIASLSAHSSNLSITLPMLGEGTERATSVSETAASALKTFQQATNTVTQGWSSSSCAQTNSTIGAGQDILSAMIRPTERSGAGTGIRAIDGGSSSLGGGDVAGGTRVNPAVGIFEELPTFSVRTTKQTVESTSVGSKNGTEGLHQPAATIDICEMSSNSPKLLAAAHAHTTASIIQSLEVLSKSRDADLEGDTRKISSMMNSQQLAMLTSPVPTRSDLYSLPPELQNVMVELSRLVSDLDTDHRNEEEERRRQEASQETEEDFEAEDGAGDNGNNGDNGGAEYVRTKALNLWQLYRQLRSAGV